MPTSPRASAPEPGRAPLGRVARSWAAWRRLASFFSGAGRLLWVLAPVSIVAGFAEAALLGLVASVALALSRGEDVVVAHLGPFELESSLGPLFVIGVVLALVRGVLHLVLAYLPANISARAMASLRRRLFDAFVGATWSVKSVERDGQFQSLMVNQIGSTAGAIIALGNGLTAAIMFLTLLGSAFTLSLAAAAVLTVSSVLLLLALRPVSRRLRRHSKALSAENIEYSQTVQEVAAMAEETQVFGASTEYRETFYERVERVRVPLLRTRYLTGAIPSLYQSAAQLMLVLALIAVSLLDVGQIATLGAVVLMLIRAQSYGQRLQQSMTSLDEKVPFMDHLADAIENYERNQQTDEGNRLTAIEALGMDRVSFSYVPGVPVVKDVSFEVSRGEAVGIVGPSGAGKSSIVQLLLRLREPTAGSVVVNGVDARQLSRADWQTLVAYVPQSPQLIWGTVADNIRFFRPGLSDEQVERAAQRAHIHDEIVSWPRAYETVIGQRASAVSGGQRQRLCLARALVAEPSVLILDEPTSALDVRSEELVQASLGEIKQTMALFLVAHRLSTLSICDRVMVVDSGRLDAFDTHARLVETNAFYRTVDEISRRRAEN